MLHAGLQSKLDLTVKNTDTKLNLAAEGAVAATVACSSTRTDVCTIVCTMPYGAQPSLRCKYGVET